MIPIVDFFGEPVLYGSLGLVEYLFLATAKLVEVLRHKMNRGVFHCLRFQVVAKPFRRRISLKGYGLGIGRRTIIEIRSRTGIGSLTMLVHFDKL